MVANVRFTTRKITAPVLNYQISPLVKQDLNKKLSDNYGNPQKLDF